MPEIEARACRTLFPQPIGQLDAALAAQYRLPGDLFQFYRSVRSLCFERHPAMHTILLDPGGFLNRLAADLILIPPRNIMTAASIDCGKSAKGMEIERD